MILSKRLQTAASFVRKSDVIADIATDHGYLPIYLLSQNIANFAYATDINTEPLKRAEINVAKANLSDKTVFLLTDGLKGLEQYSLDTILICGMGGDTIAEIIDAADFLKERRTRLVLQPMSAVDRLRKYLYNNGYTILDEAFCYDNGKYYFTLLTEYTAEITEHTVSEQYLGKNFRNDSKIKNDYLHMLYKKTEKIIAGKIQGGEDCETEKLLLAQLTELQETK